MRAHPIGEALDKAPKYVASSTLTQPTWSNTTVLTGDLACAIGELRARPRGELQVHGSGGLIDSHVDTLGVSIQTYRPAGRPQYADPLTDLRRVHARG